MKRFLDSSVLVEACLSQSPKFRNAEALVGSPESYTSAHALAETYATLSGDTRLRVHPADAARMVEDLAEVLRVHALDLPAYRRLIVSAPKNGIRGGSIYDALLAESARLCECEEIRTLNTTHFAHVAPDLKIMGL